MSSAIQFSEITEKNWQNLARQIDSNLTSSSHQFDNLFLSSRFTGSDFINSANHRFYGMILNDQVVCAAAVYKISNSVARIRSPFCISDFRGNGYTKALFSNIFKSYDPSVNKHIAFVTEEGLPFYLKMGFQKVPDILPRSLELYDAKSQTYAMTNKSLTLMSFKIPPRTFYGL